MTAPNPLGLARLVAAVSVVALLLAACGSQPPPDAALPDDLANLVDLDGVSLVVGGKEFPEQLVLCQIAVAALESAGATVTDSCGRVGTPANRRALLEGEISMYWEYTGTAWATLLDRRSAPDPDPTALYRAVRDLDAQNGVSWSAPTPMSDGYAIAVNRGNAQRLNLVTLSDMADLFNADDPNARLYPETTVCLEPEFRDRVDGWPGLQDKYRFRASPVDPVNPDGVIGAVAAGNPCVFGQVLNTDGRIELNDLVVLRDDRNVLPKYNAAMTIRQELVDDNPGLLAVFDTIAGQLDEDAMTALNVQVTRVAEAARPAAARAVARAWLRERDLIG